MKLARIISVSLLLLSSMIAPPDGLGGRLTMGAPSPSIEVSEWLMGNPIQQLKKGHVYVLVFWTTACANCRDSMAYFSEIQSLYREEATVIAVNALEPDPERLSSFLAEMEEDLNIAVAIDNGAMARNWLQAADLGSANLPVAFVVDRENRIAWIGSPEDLDEIIGPIVYDNWDLEKEAAARHRDLAKRI